MTDTEALEELIQSKGIKYSYLADCLGISYQALRNKMSNKSEFKGSEILILSEILDIRSMEEQKRLFFKQYVDKNATAN